MLARCFDDGSLIFDGCCHFLALPVTSKPDGVGDAVRRKAPSPSLSKLLKSLMKAKVIAIQCGFRFNTTYLYEATLLV